MCAAPIGTLPAGGKQPGGDVLASWAEGLASRREGVRGRGCLRFAFYGRVSTEDWQDPAMSRARQLQQAVMLTAGRGVIVAEFFDTGQSRTLACADFGSMSITMMAVRFWAFCAPTMRAGGDRWLRPGADGRACRAVAGPVSRATYVCRPAARSPATASSLCCPSMDQCIPTDLVPSPPPPGPRAARRVIPALAGMALG